MRSTFGIATSSRGASSIPLCPPSLSLKGLHVLLVEKQNYDPEFAVWLSTLAHTSPAQFGKVMAMTEPRMAVGYHFYNDHDTLPVVLQSVRTTYDGPVTLATATKANFSTFAKRNTTA